MLGKQWFVGAPKAPAGRCRLVGVVRLLLLSLGYSPGSDVSALKDLLAVVGVVRLLL